MDKTISYYIEKFGGLALAAIITFIAWKYWSFFSFTTEKDFFDKLIAITTTFFGFLLAVLTLIIQSSSPTVAAMKKHGSYKRLINYNKTIVLLSAIVCFLSLVLLLGREKMIIEQHTEILKYAGLVNFFLFLWTCFDTFVFVLIFYKIILSETSQ
jgi:hypothetical protein